MSSDADSPKANSGDSEEYIDLSHIPLDEGNPKVSAPILVSKTKNVSIQDLQLAEENREKRKKSSKPNIPSRRSNSFASVTPSSPSAAPLTSSGEEKDRELVPCGPFHPAPGTCVCLCGFMCVCVCVCVCVFVSASVCAGV